MKNERIARIFEEMADLLELKGDNPFKIRAYRRAAMNIEGLPKDIEEIARAGDLEKVPGIGKDLAKKVSEFLKSGRVTDHEQLKAEIPESLLEVLLVPGMGPKKAKYLFENHGVAGIEDLERIIATGGLKDLPGFGAKTEENILKGIALVKSGRERTPLGIAVRIAREIIDNLKGLPEIKRIEVAGSVRRCRETVKDIDVLVTSTDPVRVMGQFTSLPNVSEVLASGDTKSSIRVHEGIQVDLRVVEPDSFGAALQYFTGSKAHNVRLRDMASRKGLKINEYGIFREKGNRKMGGKEEEEIYHVLDLPLIPPEIREDLGEIDAAMKGELPELVELSDIRGDLHVHTNLSDGAHSLEEVAEYAKSLGYGYIAITEHSKSLRIAGGIDEQSLRRQIAVIDELNKKLDGFRILSGIEVDILKDGSLDFSDEVLSICDLVIASVHSGFRQPEEKMTARIINAMENPHVDLFAHPSGRLIGERESYEVDMEAIIKTAGRTNTVLEINAHPKRLDLNDRYSRMAKDLGVKLAVNTDMHSMDEFHYMELGVSVARRGWCSRGNLLNTMEVDELLRELAS
ncbi:MAG: DNA polymerase/3'-5' exonuclease PolX [Candidatus Glassbacteria bacterium]